MTDVELIKSKIDIVEFIGESVKLQKAGRNFKGLCPFHSEKTPSFVVSPERQSWHCFGACAEGGDAVKFLERMENVDFLEALKILAKRTGVTLSNYTPSDEGKLRDKLYEINHLASEFYHFLLTGHPTGQRALKYLKDRGIKDRVITAFGIGYAPASWDSLLKYLLKKGYERKDILTAGLVVSGNGGRIYDRFRGRLMFTLRDHRGNAVGFSGRKLPPENEKEAKYINTSETPVYIKGNTLYGLDVTREEIKKEKEAVVVEGEFDMLSAFQSGVGNIVAIKGSALTEGQVSLLKRYTETLILALDSDFAGNEAAKRGIEVAENAGMTVRVVRLPFGKDPAECVAHDPYLFKKAVKEAVPIYDFLIDNAVLKYGVKDALGKKKIAGEVLPFLSRLSNPIISSHYQKLLARKLEVTEESVEMALSQVGSKRKPAEAAPAVAPAGNRQVLLEEHLLSLVVQAETAKSAADKMFGKLELSDFDQPAVKQIAERLFSYFKNNDKFEVKKFSALLSPEIMPEFDRIFLTDIDSILAKPEIFKEELKRSILEVKKQAIRRKVNEISTKLRNEDEAGDEEKQKILNEELRNLIEKLHAVDK